MQKELIICIVIVVAITVGNTLTHNNTKNVVEEMREKLNNISSEIESKVSNEKIRDSINASKETWDEKCEGLAYYVEHDELEKVSEALVKIRANISAEEYSTATENVDSCIFLLQHIEEKDKFNLKNIF